MTLARTAGLFLLLAVAAGMTWCWAEFGSPMIYFLPPSLPLLHLIAAAVLGALTVGLPGALCATGSHLRHRRGAHREATSALADPAGPA